jgi:hypothetical protein
MYKEAGAFVLREREGAREKEQERERRKGKLGGRQEGTRYYLYSVAHTLKFFEHFGGISLTSARQSQSALRRRVC